jgi:ABC-type protease/lipase transport system fused ATPase/permease subunit
MDADKRRLVFLGLVGAAVAALAVGTVVLVKYHCQDPVNRAERLASKARATIEEIQANLESCRKAISGELASEKS